MFQLWKRIVSLSRGFNSVACSAIIIMMALTCADVVLRFFRYPIPGTYEIIGFLGAVLISFSLAYTSVEKSHIIVELFVNPLPERIKAVIDAFGALLGLGLFAIVTWQSVLYAMELKRSKEVSMTLQMPLYPFAYGLALGCGMLCFVLLFDIIRSWKRAIKK